MKKFIIILLLLIPSVVNALGYTSNGDGDWEVIATWDLGGAVPGVGDTAVIRAGDTVTINQNLDVGMSPANLTTYNVDILGTLIVTPTPAADVLIIFRSSVRIQNGGIFSVGTAATRVDCGKYVIIQMRTATGQKYILRVEDGATLIARGCEGYPASAGIETRARITACAPNCNAGAITLTLDTTVNWQASVNPITVGGTGNPQVIIGSGGGVTNPGADLSELIEVTGFPAPTQIDVTTGNNHQVGDVVVNTTRNVLFTSSTPPTQGRIYSSGGRYNLSWIAINEMGDSTSAPSIDFDDTAKNIGTWSYIAATNCEDGGSVICFEAGGMEFDTIEYLTAYNMLATNGIHFASMDDPETVIGLTVMKGTGVGVATANAYPPSFDGLWVNGVATGFDGQLAAMTDSLFHFVTTSHITASALYSYYSKIIPVISGNEFFHANTNDSINWSPLTGWFKNNEFYDVDNNCIEILSTGSVDLYFENNTYDLCNNGGTGIWGAIYIIAKDGDIYMQAEDFGSVAPNENANIVWVPPLNTTALVVGNMRLTCNECILTPATAQTQPTPIHIAPYTNWTGRAYIGPQAYLTVHNKDAVSGDHWGYGPGGMEFERETVIVVDNTLNLKITPYSASAFNYFKVGTIHVTVGQTLTVNAQIRKDEAQAIARTPRLALKGCGFDVLSDFDAMSDVTDTWETQTVSGVVNATGIVHIYIGVMGELDGGAYMQCVEPPTLDVYVDGVSHTKI